MTDCLDDVLSVGAFKISRDNYGKATHVGTLEVIRKQGIIVQVGTLMISYKKNGVVDAVGSLSATYDSSGKMTYVGALEVVYKTKYFSKDNLKGEGMPTTEWICPNCKTNNLQGARFCQSCGTKLFYSCPICETQTYIAAKFCTGCGSSMEEADEKIIKARKMRGEEQREISYFYKSKGSYSQARTARYTLDIDEYVIDKHWITLSQHDGFNTDVTGQIYLTNKKIIFLGCDTQFFISGYTWDYEFYKITKVQVVEEKFLFMKMHYLIFLYDGRMRKLSIPDNSISTWLETINEYIRDNK